jgi:oxygen-dependent protoporphyrinogen oxidase
MPKTVIIGAGISGIVAAYQLMQQGGDVLLLEASGSVGGVIGTEHKDGYLLERGPNTLRGNTPALEALIGSLGLEKLEADASSKSRYILRDERLIQLPQQPFDIFSTSILSAGAKFRAVREPLVAASTAQDESVGAFFSRRFGSEVADYLVDPFVSGIYAGDKDRLSIRHTFPKLWQLEHHAGSVIKGMLKGRKKKPDRTGPSAIYSFANGISELPLALAKELGSHCSTGTAVAAITRDNNRYTIELSAGSSISADSVIVATPAPIASSLIQPFAPEASELLKIVSYAPIASLSLGYKNEQFAKLPSGFGFLVPSNAKQSFLGCIFSSSMFPNRAPAGSTLLTVMVGGSMRPELTKLSAMELTAIILPELTKLLAIRGEPELVHLHAYQQAIPQYEMGYQVILDALRKTEAANPGLHLLGSYRGGVSVGDCVRNATELAARLV